MLTIELCGLPGCGKSTVASSAAESLKAEGLRVADRRDIYYFGCRNRRKGKASVRMAFKFRHWGLYRKMIRMNRNHSRGLKTIRYAFRLMFFASQLEEAEKSGRFDLALMDEGMLHYTSALADNDAITDPAETEPLLRQMDDELPRRKVVRCGLTAEESARRIQGRGVEAKRFSSALAPEELVKRLRQREATLDTLSKNRCDLVLDMVQPAEASRDQLLAFIRRELSEE